MYGDLINTLHKAKSSADSSQMYQAVMHVLDCLERIPYDRQLRKQCMSDELCLFIKVKEKVHQFEGVDYLFSTDGYPADVIHQCGIIDGKLRVLELQKALFNIDNTINMSEPDVDEAIREYHDILADIKHYMEMFALTS